jgi:hypothetical protein
MQFLQATFDGMTARHTIPPGGANPPSRYNPHDAIYTAAYYLCGVPPTFRTADLIRSAPEWRMPHARTAEEIHA